MIDFWRNDLFPLEIYICGSVIYLKGSSGLDFLKPPGTLAAIELKRVPH